MLVTAAFVSFVQVGVMPAWMCVLIISREIAIMGLRLIAAAENTIIEADILGKFKTTIQFATIIVILFILPFKEAVFIHTQKPWQELFIGSRWEVETVYLLENVPMILLWLTLYLTISSAISYFYKNRRFLK